MKKEYAVLIDRKASYGHDPYQPFMVDAKDVITAMNIAETYMDETVFLVKVLEKSSGTSTADGYKAVEFREVMVNRGRGWHSADKNHGESTAYWNRCRSLKRDSDWEYWNITFLGY